MNAGARPTAIDLMQESDFSLGILRIRPASHEVVGPQGTEALEPRVMQVLVALAQRRGQVVAREELSERCSAGRVVGDDAISRCIVKVRKLAETTSSFSVETIARTGYRLTETALPAEPSPVADKVDEPPPVQSRPPTRD